MKVREFINIYRSDKRVRDIADAVHDTGAGSFFIRGLSGSASSVIAAAVSTLVPCPSLFILPDKEAAVYFFNDLENLLNEKDLPAERRSVFFMPSSYKKPFEKPDIDNNNVLMRSEVINRLISDKAGFLIVTHPEALAEKMISKNSIEKSSITVIKDQSVSVDTLIEMLAENDFERVEFVIEPGQFSVRGGIIDVFSFSNDLPFRIEIFGDKTESLRTFNPETQLTVRLSDKLEILPDIRKMAYGNEFTDLFSAIPQRTILWLEDAALTAEIIENSFLKACDIFHHLYPGEEHALAAEDVFITASFFAEKLDKFNVIEFGRQHLAPDHNVFEFNFSPQPSFNKNFELLREDLHRKTSEGYRNLILSDNARQINRLHSIFDAITVEKPDMKGFKHDIMMIAIHSGFVDHHNKIACYTDHQIFDRYHRFRLRNRLPARQAFTLREFNSLRPGDYVTHIDHGIGIYGGLEKIEVNGKLQEAIRLMYKGGDILYISIHSLHRIARYTGKDSKPPVLHRLGSNAWSNLKKKTRQKVKDIASDLIKLYAERKAKKGISFSPDTYLQNELEASFIYEDTPDQVKATADTKKDMEVDYPMDRLICGDVGFGKTEVAIRAAFKAVAESKQVAVLVPTTILALQHYHTFTERLKELPCSINYINRFRPAREKKQILSELEEGRLDIVIGTHRLISKDIRFKDLGLLIIDEEQKFGVKAKEQLKRIKTNVDTLTLTATPIPRTLQFSLMGARDLSLINTPPPNRYPIVTEVHVFGEELIREAIMYEVSRGGQVFFVHNRVENINDVAGIIRRICPGIDVAVGHGKMEGKILEKVMIDFINGDHDVLVSTTIVESGLDIPNANTIIINNAHHFGLSDLHQMRGRVGRSNKKAFCYLLAPPISTLTGEARKRLKALEEFSELGSGFNIAMRDLDIRGAGNIIGAEQSGFINEIGFETYHKILDEAIAELKENEFKDIFKTDDEKPKEKSYVDECLLETDLELLIPSDYVSSIEERLVLYKDLDSIKSYKELNSFANMLRDRFGPIPQETLGLFDAVKLRWLAAKLGFEKVVIKSEKFIGYFISNQQSEYYNSDTFKKVLQFVQSNGRLCGLKETGHKLSLTIKNVRDIKQVFEYLKQMDEKVGEDLSEHA